MKKEIRFIALASIFSALIVVFITLGTFIEILDITVAAICAIAVHIIRIETNIKYQFLVYITSSILCLIFTPLSTATIYYIGFFGYYPIIRQKLSKLKKTSRKIICTLLFNAVMFLLMLLFKAVFALQNEPPEMYVTLLIMLNVLFFCFDYLLDIFIFIYLKKIRPKFKKH